MENFVKVIRPGTVQQDGRTVSVFAKIEFNNGRLSITGVVGPLRNGDCVGSCGQIEMGMDNAFVQSVNYVPGWNAGKLFTLLAIWRKWHLNDMKAGTNEQEAILDQHNKEYTGYPLSYYDFACNILKSYGMYEHNGYKYGSAWLRQEVPENVIAFLRELPDSDKEPLWI